MCGGGKAPKTPEIPAPTPIPPPTPIPQPSQVSPQDTPEQMLNRQRKLRQGVLSTIKTRPAGIMGAGADLSSGEGKKVLGG
jgi:hypothetical protein